MVYVINSNCQDRSDINAKAYESDSSMSYEQSQYNKGGLDIYQSVFCDLCSSGSSCSVDFGLHSDSETASFFTASDSPFTGLESVGCQNEIQQYKSTFSDGCEFDLLLLQLSR